MHIIVRTVLFSNFYFHDNQLTTLLLCFTNLFIYQCFEKRTTSLHSHTLSWFWANCTYFL